MRKLKEFGNGTEGNRRNEKLFDCLETKELKAKKTKECREIDMQADKQNIVAASKQTSM